MDPITQTPVRSKELLGLPVLSVYEVDRINVGYTRN